MQPGRITKFHNASRYLQPTLVRHAPTNNYYSLTYNGETITLSCRNLRRDMKKASKLMVKQR